MTEIDTLHHVHIVEDDEAVADAISFLLDSVGISHSTYPHAQAFLDQFEQAKGCLVLDIRMPGMSGLELQRQLHERGSQLPIVFVTGHGDVPMAVQAMRLGAVDFLRKPFRDQELLDSVNEALAIAQRTAQAGELQQQAQALLGQFTPREHEVFHRVTDGQANKVIALELGISERTVEIHRANVMQKAGARSLPDLVRLRLASEAVDR